MPVIATFARFELSGRSTMLSFRDWLNDRCSLSRSLSPPPLCLSNVNEFKQPAPTHTALFLFPSFSLTTEHFQPWQVPRDLLSSS